MIIKRLSIGLEHPAENYGYFEGGDIPTCVVTNVLKEYLNQARKICFISPFQIKPGTVGRKSDHFEVCQVSERPEHPVVLQGQPGQSNI